jgi:Trypsin-co-occurring domain 1
MSDVVEVRLPTGQVIHARVADTGPRDVGLGDRQWALSLDDLQDTVEGVTQTVYQALQRVKPHTVSLEIGIELAVQTGKLTSLLAEASGKGSMKLTLSWNTADGLPLAPPEEEKGA